MLCTVIVIILVKLVQKISNRFGKSFYSMSFNEGNTTNTLEITAKERVKYIENSENLSNSIIDNNSSEFIYRMSFNNKKDLQDFKKKLDEEKI